MKKIVTTFILLLAVSLTATAQQGINYKALIKDGSGNVLANQLIVVQFDIQKGVALTSVYKEQQTPTTDANGLVILTIGQVITPLLGNFTTIDWASDTYFLNVQVNTGTGLVDMGTTEFMAVPYAKHAETATNAANTTSANNGLTIDGNSVIDNGAGWHRSYGDTGWYNGTYGGGIYMKNSTWVEVYGNKSFLIPNGNFQVGSSGGTFKAESGSAIASNGFRTTGSFTPSSGAGIEIGYMLPGVGYVQSTDRSNSTFKDLALFGRYVGVNTSSPSSALDVNGVFRATGNTWPTTGAGVELAYNYSLGIGYIQSVNRNTNPDTFNDLAIGALNLRPVSNNFTSLGTSTNKWTAVYAVNGTIQTSDRRMKKDIHNLNYGLNTVMQLRPVSYKWKKGNQDVNLGLIAQEVQKLIPEVVDVGDDKDKTLGMKYTELIPILIKAIQEQQKIIEQQKSNNQQLKAELSTQNKSIESLVKRMEALEAYNQ